MKQAWTQRILSLTILFACCCCAFALDPSLDVSQYAHTSWKVRDGFAQGEIAAIAQTPDGYLWLGTEFGLLRFDGVRPIRWQPPGNQHLPPGYHLQSARLPKWNTLDWYAHGACQLERWQAHPLSGVRRGNCLLLFWKIMTAWCGLALAGLPLRVSCARFGVAQWVALEGMVA